MLENFLSFLRESPATAYWIVLFGSMIEGETIILGASALAAAGYLSVTKIGGIAFLSTLIVDQGLYFVGHYLYKHPGQPLSEKFPRLYRRSKRAVLYLKKYDIWFILLFRFIYGIRAISPVVIGLCGSPPRRFVPLNMVSALLWATVSCALGYCLGDFLFDSTTGGVVEGHMHRIQAVIVGALVTIVVSFVVVRQIAQFRQQRRRRLPGVDPLQTQHVEKDFYESTHSKNP